MYSAKDRMIIALDFPTADQAKELVEKIGDGATFINQNLTSYMNFVSGLALRER